MLGHCEISTRPQSKLEKEGVTDAFEARIAVIEVL
jgi:hypothetical protein